MMPVKVILISAFFFLSLNSFSCTEDGSQGIVAENNLKIPVNAKRVGGLTEAQFNMVIDKVSSFYTPIVTAAGATLKVARNWTDGTVNAYASRSGTTWNVSMFGGLARHATITEDGFALVVCHEIGHHIGGAPKKTDWWSGTSWATNEGQADYFATLKCLRRTFEAEDNAAVVATLNAPKEVSDACSAAWTNDNDVNMCIRSAMAGDSVAKLFAALGNEKEAMFTTPDPKVVTATNHNHPATQCRLDTYFQGSLCDVDFKVDVVQDSEVTGTCHQSRYTEGVRPLCWFKPTM
jgi:hypothetical protein